MANIHVMESPSLNTYRIIVHGAAPAGNNSAAVPWATAIANSGRNKTRMTTGAGAGQITSAEAAAITAGTTIETTGSYTDDPNLTTVQRQTALDQVAAQVLAELQAQYQQDLKFFGFTR